MVLQRFLAVSKAVLVGFVCLWQKSYEKLMEHHTGVVKAFHRELLLR